jgi:hypothetical protein
MSTPAQDLLSRLAVLGAMVERQGDKLVLRAGIAPVPGDILAAVRQRKEELLDALSPDAERDAFEERAAIMEFDGGLSREEAEREAIKVADCRN